MGLVWVAVRAAGVELGLAVVAFGRPECSITSTAVAFDVVKALVTGTEVIGTGVVLDLARVNFCLVVPVEDNLSGAGDNRTGVVLGLIEAGVVVGLVGIVVSRVGAVISLGRVGTSITPTAFVFCLTGGAVAGTIFGWNCAPGITK